MLCPFAYLLKAVSAVKRCLTKTSLFSFIGGIEMAAAEPKPYDGFAHETF